METEINKNTEFSPALIEQIKGYFAHYPEIQKKSALLPSLHAAQAEFGWLSTETMDQVASLLSIKPIEVYEVASFYSMYHLKPQGKYVLEVCRTGPCCLAGAERIVNYIEQKLGIKVGETTADKLFSLKTVECLAACGTGPVLQIGPLYTYYENLSEQSIDSLLEELKNK